MAAHPHAGPAPDPVRPMPPVTELGAAAMVCIAASVIYTASYLPRHAPLAVPVALGAVAGLLMVTCLVLLSRVEHFAWARFRQVAAYALAAYLIIGGMIEYAFVYDHTRGHMLIVLTVLIALFACLVPLLIAFTVARYAKVEA